MKQTKAESHIIPCDNVQTKDWYAWIDMMPPRPYSFHVTGEVLVPNPGVDVILIPKEPQGINPDILLMDLFLHQKPGVWPEIVVWKPARYDKVGTVKYKQVDIFCGSKSIAQIKVDIVS